MTDRIAVSKMTGSSQDDRDPILYRGRDFYSGAHLVSMKSVPRDLSSRVK
jgi:hypothetical protein